MELDHSHPIIVVKRVRTVQQKEAEKLRKQQHRLDNPEDEDAHKKKHNSYYANRTNEQIEKYERHKEELVENNTEERRAEIRQVVLSIFKNVHHCIFYKLLLMFRNRSIIFARKTTEPSTEEQSNFTALNRHGIMIIRVLSVDANGLKVLPKREGKSVVKTERFLIWILFQHSCHFRISSNASSWSGPNI
jgi:hypothetical protein